MSAAAKTRWSAEELKHAKELAREYLKTQRVETPTPTPSPAPAPSAQFGPLFRAAAVSSRFRMEDLEGSDAGEAERLREMSIALRERAGAGSRTLPPDVRNAVLRTMTSAEISAEIDNFAQPNDPLQSALRRALKGLDVRDLMTLDSGEIGALVQVHEGISAQLKLPQRSDLERKLELARLLEPLKAITGTFNGREAELQKLRDYVGVVPPASLVGKLVRVITAPFTATRKAPFLVWGPGGVGKTTLTARFILDHALIEEKLQFPFAYLDFDRPTVMANKAATILVEAVRQIGLQYDGAYPASERFRARWEQALRATTSTDESLEETVAENFALFLETLEVREGPVLFVLDTFEEVQRRSAAYAESVIELVQKLAERVPRLRVVIAGRSEIESVKFEDMQPLVQFDEASAVAYLVAHGVDPSAAGDIFSAVGGSPLALSLALQIYRRDPKELRERVNFKIDSTQLQDEVIQAQLFDRILLHIEDPDVQRLAHPGLVLRRVTPELIREVLAGPCGIEVRDEPHALALFEKLAAEATLVSRPEPRVLVHRADVRKLMLGPLRRDDPRKVEEIHRLAIGYYKNQNGDIARAEEVYHRLSLGESRDVIAPLVKHEMEPFLSGALDELQPPEQALLADLLDLDLSADARKAADDLTWERATSRRLSEWIRTRTFNVDAADALLSERWQRSAVTDLRVFEATFFQHSGALSRAQQIAEEGVAAYRNAGNREMLVRMLLVAAAIDRGAEQYESAHARLNEAAGIADRRDDPLMIAQVLRERAETFRAEGAELDSESRADFIAAAKRVRDADWRSDLASLRAVAEEVGSEAPTVLARALRLGALELSASGLEFLRTVLQEHGIEVKEVNTTLHELLEHGSPPPGVLDAMTRVLQSEAAQRVRRGASKRDDASGIRLKTAQRTQLRDLLAQQFGTGLASFIESRFSVGLEALSLAEDVPSTTMDLIGVAERQGWIGELLISFGRARFKNAEVLRFLDSIGLGITIRDTPSMSEKAIRSFIDDNRGRIGALAARTCIVQQGGEQIGCGFLTAVDEVTTLASLPEKTPGFRYEYRFDSVSLKNFADPGRILSPLLPKSRWDFWGERQAIEIFENVGAEPLERYTTDAAALPRGAVTVDPRPYVAGEPLFWLWREEGATFISGVVQKESRYKDGRLILDASSSAMAAGSPCFDARLNVIGIHCGPSARNSKQSLMLPLARGRAEPISFAPQSAPMIVESPLVNRMSLRGTLDQLVRGVTRILVVQGTPRSGKSYTRQFLRQLLEPRDVSLVEIDLREYAVGEEIRPYDLGVSIANALGTELPPSLDWKMSRWTLNFLNWLPHQVRDRNLWIVFDHFSKVLVSVPDSVYEFIAFLAERIRDERVRTMRLVLIDYNRELPRETRAITSVEVTPTIGREDIRRFFFEFLPEHVPERRIDPHEVDQLTSQVIETMKNQPDDPLQAMSDTIRAICRKFVSEI